MEQVATPQVAGAPEAVAEVAAPEAQPEVKKYKVKVNDQEHEVDEKELIAGYQTRKASDEKFRRAAEIERKYQEEKKEIDLWKKDPKGFFDKHGMSAEEWAENLLIEKLKYESLSPDTKRALEAEKKLEKIEEEKRAQQEELDKQELKSLSYKAAESIDQDIHAAITGAKLTNVKPAFIRMVADKMLAHLDHQDGERSMSAEQAVKLVREQIHQAREAEEEALPVDEYMRLLSPERRDAIRKYFVGQVVDNSPMRKPLKAETTPREPSSKKAKAVTTEEFFNNLEKKYS